VVLSALSRPRLAQYTGLYAETMVALHITFENPLAGMSMNPARSVGSAVLAEVWTGTWIYFVAPPLGMLLGAELVRLTRLARGQACAKLHHDARVRCIFCEHQGS
jgi:aquaporin Z